MDLRFNVILIKISTGFVVAFEISKNKTKPCMEMEMTYDSQSNLEKQPSRRIYPT